MGIAIRTSKLVNNRLRVSLDIYHRGKSKLETLDLFLYEKPTSVQERDHNKKTKAIAESIKAKRILELQENRYNVFTGFKSQASFVEYFGKLTHDRRKSGGNYGNWYSAHKLFLKFLNGRDVNFEQCDEQLLNSFKKYLLNEKVTKSNTKLAQNSASSYFDKVKAALNQAYDDKIIIDNPARRVASIKPAEDRREYLLIEEIRALVNTECEYDTLKRAFLFSVLTGLRWSDIQKLTWQEVSYSEEEKIFKLQYRQQKTGTIQYHPIQDQAFNLLGDRSYPDHRVFKGLKYSAHNNHRLKLWVLKAGISKKVTFHTARHSFATLMLTQGVDLYTVSNLLGHKEIKTTQIYAKVIDKKRNEAVNLLPSITV